MKPFLKIFLGYETRKGVQWSFVPLAFSFFAYSAHWWTDTEGSRHSDND